MAAPPRGRVAEWRNGGVAKWRPPPIRRPPRRPPAARRPPAGRPPAAPPTLPRPFLRFTDSRGTDEQPWARGRLSEQILGPMAPDQGPSPRNPACSGHLDPKSAVFAALPPIQFSVAPQPVVSRRSWLGAGCPCGGRPAAVPLPAPDRRRHSLHGPRPAVPSQLWPRRRRRRSQRLARATTPCAARARRHLSAGDRDREECHRHVEPVRDVVADDRAQE